MLLKYKKVILITCNIPNKIILKKIINYLLKKKIVSCINSFNKINSFYYWNNKIKKKKEIKIILKSFWNYKKKIIKIIKKLHPYKIPEILIFNVNKTNKEYLYWMNEVVK